jgi:hypothetical protein
MDAFIQLSTAFDWGNEDYYRNVRDDLKYAILTHMYDHNHKQFVYKIEKSNKPGHRRKHLSDWNTFNPDTYAQLFPIYLRIWPDNDPNGRKKAWHKIYQLHHDHINKKSVLNRIIYKWTALSIGDIEAYSDVSDGTKKMEKKNEKKD